jgi:hypothetical protein
MDITGRKPALTSTQSYFCAVMGQRRKGGEPSVQVLELAEKFGCTESTIRNAEARRYTKHHEFRAREVA